MRIIYFIKDAFLSKLGETLIEMLPTTRIAKGARVAIKMHMGELGNLYYVRPPIVGKVVEVLKQSGLDPFVFDTPTFYRGARHTPAEYLETARKNGFTEETIGCPIVISDDSQTTETPYSIGEVAIPKVLTEADALVVLSHFKGHCDAGFGGAIKNLGMGCVDMGTKRKMHTTLSQPVVSDSCTLCGTCVDTCANQALSLGEDRLVLDSKDCFGCGACSEACPEEAIRPRVNNLRVLLAEAASAVLGHFDEGCLLFVNVLLDVTKFCDCMRSPMAKVVDDIGILVSCDPLAIDKCSLDMVNEKAGRNVFRELHKLDPEVQLRRAAELGLGSMDYRIVEK